MDGRTEGGRAGGNDGLCFSDFEASEGVATTSARKGLAFSDFEGSASGPSGSCPKGLAFSDFEGVTLSSSAARGKRSHWHDPSAAELRTLKRPFSVDASTSGRRTKKQALSRAGARMEDVADTGGPPPSKHAICQWRFRSATLARRVVLWPRS